MKMLKYALFLTGCIASPYLFADATNSPCTGAKYTLQLAPPLQIKSVTPVVTGGGADGTFTINNTGSTFVAVVQAAREPEGDAGNTFNVGVWDPSSKDPTSGLGLRIEVWWDLQNGQCVFDNSWPSQAMCMDLQTGASIDCPPGMSPVITEPTTTSGVGSAATATLNVKGQ